MSDNKSITLSDVEAVYRELQLASGGDSWLEVDGCIFYSDIGYAFDGIDIYHKFLLQLFGEDFIPACEGRKKGGSDGSGKFQRGVPKASGDA